MLKPLNAATEGLGILGGTVYSAWTNTIGFNTADANIQPVSVGHSYYYNCAHH